jgi:hypothetical protein
LKPSAENLSIKKKGENTNGMCLRRSRSLANDRRAKSDPQGEKHRLSQQNDGRHHRPEQAATAALASRSSFCRRNVPVGGEISVVVNVRERVEMLDIASLSEISLA